VDVNGPPPFVKARPHPDPQSIPGLLDMFRREVRFYREVAPEVGVRVPTCSSAEETADGFRLELEDLSDWAPGGDPVAVAGVLAQLHGRWEGEAERRWPWLDRDVPAAAEAVGVIYDRTWPAVAERPDLTPAVRAGGAALVGQVAALERAEVALRPRTIVHGDARLANVRTSPTGDVALLDWEDVRLSSGAVDLAWLLVASVEPERWDDVLAAGHQMTAAVRPVMPTAAAQAILSLADVPVGAPEAAAWVRRIERALAP
jgi:hypothetical protein